MPILHSYYQDVYRCPIVRLDGYSAQHGLSTGCLLYTSPSPRDCS